MGQDHRFRRFRRYRRLDGERGHAVTTTAAGQRAHRRARRRTNAAGWKARLAALAICLFVIPATLIFHNFWAVDPAQAQGQMIHFMKNLTIMGGMMYVMAFGAGPLSVDARKP